MFKLKIITVGKSKELWLQQALSEYEKRLSPYLVVEWILAKNDSQLEELLAKEATFVALDPRGKVMTSEQFATWFFHKLEENKSRLCLAIGGADGFSDKTRKKASFLLSLSPMTFTHQATRLILLEQIYRATEIQRGSKYHK